MNKPLCFDLTFEFVGKLPSFKITMDGQEELFILDSGAPNMVLNSKYETSSDIKLMKLSGASSNTSDVCIKRVPSLAWGELTLENQTALVLDLSHLEEKLNVRIRGLFGYESIKNFDVLYNYAERKISLINPHLTQTERRLTYPLSFSVHPHIPIIPVSIRNSVFHMGIDSGAEANLLDVRYWDALNAAGAVVSYKEESLTDIIKSDTGVKTGELGPVTVCGKIHFDSMLFMFSDISHLQVQSDAKLDGIIGYELLSKMKTLVSYTRKEVSFGS